MTRELLTHPLETLCQLAERPMAILNLPYPPTTNNLYMNVGKRRIRSPEYDGWLASATSALRAQHFRPILGVYHLRMIVDRPDRRARDIDNLIKPVSDLLKKAGVIADDSKAKSVAAEWSDAEPGKPASVRVCVEGI